MCQRQVLRCVICTPPPKAVTAGKRRGKFAVQKEAVILPLPCFTASPRLHLCLPRAWTTSWPSELRFRHLHNQGPTAVAIGTSRPVAPLERLSRTRKPESLRVREVPRRPITGRSLRGRGSGDTTRESVRTWPDICRRFPCGMSSVSSVIMSPLPLPSRFPLIGTLRYLTWQSRDPYTWY